MKYKGKGGQFNRRARREDRDVENGEYSRLKQHRSRKESIRLRVLSWCFYYGAERRGNSTEYEYGSEILK